MGGGRPRVPEGQRLHRLPVEGSATGIFSGSTAHLRFQEWVAAGVFLELWRTGLERYDELQGLWSWSMSRGKKPGCSLSEAQGIPVGLAVDGANRHVLPCRCLPANLQSSHGLSPGQGHQAGFAWNALTVKLGAYPSN